MGFGDGIKGGAKIRAMKQKEGLKGLNPFREMAYGRDSARKSKKLHKIVKEGTGAVNDVQKSLKGTIDVDDFVESIAEFDEVFREELELVRHVSSDFVVKAENMLMQAANIKKMMMQVRSMRVDPKNEKATKAVQLSNAEIGRLNEELEALKALFEAMKQIFHKEVAKTESIEKAA